MLDLTYLEKLSVGVDARSTKKQNLCDEGEDLSVQGPLTQVHPLVKLPVPLTQHKKVLRCQLEGILHFILVTIWAVKRCKEHVLQDLCFVLDIEQLLFLS